MHARRDYDYLDVENEDLAFYPPILDKTPSFAASSMTKEDMEKSYAALLDVFKSLKQHADSLYTILQIDITRNHVNYKWFASLYYKLCELMKEEPLEDLMKHSPRFKVGSTFDVQYPYYISKNKKLEYYRYNVEDENDVVAGYRLKYISSDLELDDFHDGFPAWYSFVNTTVFEKYSERTNIRVRIDFCDNAFVYYVAGASDNWHQILGIPVEMDDIIKTIIFR